MCRALPVIHDVSYILGGMVLGLALLVVGVAAAVQFADTNLFQEKDTP